MKIKIYLSKSTYYVLICKLNCKFKTITNYILQEKNQNILYRKRTILPFYEISATRDFISFTRVH